MLLAGLVLIVGLVAACGEEEPVGATTTTVAAISSDALEGVEFEVHQEPG